TFSLNGQSKGAAMAKAKNPAKRHYLPIGILFSSLKACQNPKLVTVHNHVRPQPWSEFLRSGSVGLHGFREWRCHKHKGLEVCDCGWATSAWHTLPNKKVKGPPRRNFLLPSPDIARQRKRR